MVLPAAACLGGLIFSIAAGTQTLNFHGLGGGRTKLFGRDASIGFIEAVGSGDETIAGDTTADLAKRFVALSSDKTINDTAQTLDTAGARAPPALKVSFPVIYSIMTCDGPSYTAMAEAQLSTWARDLPRDNMVIVGGPHDDASEGVEGSMGFECPDSQADVSCKEAVRRLR